MKAEYCVVGPAIVLEGDGDRAAGERLMLDGRGREGTALARLEAALRDDVVRVELPHAARPLAPSEVTEMVRLFARVCTDFWMYRFPLEIASAHDLPAEVQAALLADGFVLDGQSRWTRDPAPFPAR